MKSTTLAQRINKFLRIKSGSIAVKYQDIVELLEFPEKTLHPCGYYGRGRFTSIKNGYYADICAGLRLIGIDFEKGNDAPRGGASGEFIRLTKKGKLQVKEYAKEKAEHRRIQEEQANESKRISAIAHAERLKPIVEFLTKNKERFLMLVERWEKKGKNRNNAERSAAWSLSGRDGEFSLKGETVRDILEAWKIVDQD